jgi:hypothetical protein
MPGRRHGSGNKGNPAVKNAVFLNIPYDPPFSPLFLAYVSGISAFGLAPRATLEIPGSSRRLDRIIALIKSCRYSIHDLSRVELDTTPPPTPRFNMPFELGLAVALDSAFPRKQHSWFVFETSPWRIQKSLSDLNGTDAYIHSGAVEGVFRELAKAFVRLTHQPTVEQMRLIYERTVSILPKFLSDAGSEHPFQARVFQDLVLYTGTLARELTTPS